MRVVRQLIDHLSTTGHLSEDQLVALREMGLLTATAEEIREIPPADAVDDPEPDVDHLDRLGDELAGDTRRHRAGGRRRPSIAARLAHDLERAVAEERRWAPLLHVIARTIDATVTEADSPAVIANASAATCQRALAQDERWADAWPFIAREPVADGLTVAGRQRFRVLHDERGGLRGPLPARLAGTPAVRQAARLVAAHRKLTRAFGLLRPSLHAATLVNRLPLATDASTYEAMVILHSATTTRLSIGELESVADRTGLPTPHLLATPSFVASWSVAARIDPMAVLPFMASCEARWQTPRAQRLFGATTAFTIMNRDYVGHWRDVDGTREWFGLAVIDDRWTRIRATPHRWVPRGEISQRVFVGSHEYVHRCTPAGCPPPRIFQRPSGTDPTVIREERLSGPPPMRTGLGRADYHSMWASRLDNQPLLTCPREWELT